MKIKGISSTRRGLERGASLKQDKVKGSRIPHVEGTQKGVSFIEELRQTADLKTKETLDEILGDIDQAAKRFLEYPVYENLLKYKERVQRFMKVVISRLYKTRETLSSRAVDPQKVYTLLEEVDKNLKLLLEEVLSGQADSISLMAKVDEIRGLLVDLYT